MRLVTAACETGGRFNWQAAELVETAAFFRARTEVPALRKAAARAWRARWLCMLSVCVQDALAATLVDEGLSLLDSHGGPPPNATEVWLDDRGG